MSEDSGEAPSSPLQSIKDKLLSGPFGENEGTTRARVIESEFNAGELVGSARNAILSFALPALLMLSRGPIDNATAAELQRNPNPGVSAKLDALYKTEADYALPVFYGQSPAFRAASGVADLLSHIELYREATMHDDQDK
ncbi:hypothetical protein KBD09_01785 [Candidatus Woesebacteria bacterium]|nr:hypothetical protein [Candidatus Woesebacteria bacterium]